eukprot:s266_g32.t1
MFIAWEWSDFTFRIMSGDGIRSSPPGPSHGALLPQAIAKQGAGADTFYKRHFDTLPLAVALQCNIGGSRPHNSERMLGSWAKWIGQKSVPLILGSGVSGSVIAIAWNATEQDR